MREETERFVSHVIEDDRSIMEFLDADYTFLNERLAKHYGIEGVSGDEFRLVKLDATAAPRRPAHAGQHPDTDLAAHAHLAGEARQSGCCRRCSTILPRRRPRMFRRWKRRATC